MGHPKAKLTEFGRLLLVQRMEATGYSAAGAAGSVGVSRATAYKWRRRFHLEGATGLRDRSSRARRQPRALGDAVVRQVLTARRERRAGPHRLAAELGLGRSTVYAVLRRHGLSRLSTFDRATAVPIRYVRERPGELLHLDVKKLGRIPVGGGHRLLGRPSQSQYKARQPLRGHDFLHVAVDDASRLAFVQARADQRAESCAAFLLAAADFYAQRGIHIERVLTDRAPNYVISSRFRAAVTQLGARHKMTRPYRPQTNGKAERFIRTMLQEWAYAKLYVTNQARLDALPVWLDFYNGQRSHTALGGLAPSQWVVNKASGNYT
jgi:transposase InsO family protein